MAVLDSRPLFPFVSMRIAMPAITVRPFIHRIFLFIALLAGCANPDQHITTSALSDNHENTSYFECPGNVDIPVHFDHDRAWLFLPGETVNLPQLPSASGIKYSDGSYTFWSKGESGSFWLGNTTYTDCRNNRAKASWEHAKLTGGHFRALGNEPGWILEIYSDRIVYITAYGQSSTTINSPHFKITKASKKTIYQTINDTTNDVTPLIIELTPGPCFDSMSGEEFSTSVKIVSHSSTHHGCGNPLH